jgi:hypothetical protein
MKIKWQSWRTSYLNSEKFLVFVVKCFIDSVFDIYGLKFKYYNKQNQTLYYYVIISLDFLLLLYLTLSSMENTYSIIVATRI